MEALLVSPSVASASRRSGISERTLFRYLADDSFRRAMRSRRADGLRQATNLLTYAAAGCVARLMTLANDDNPGVAGPNARALLAQAYAAIETTDILERLQSLEARLGDGDRRPPLPFPAKPGQRTAS